MSVPSSVLLARIPWVTVRQLEYWVEKGWVRPSNPGTGARGPGNGRSFPDAEARVLTVMARLVRAGLQPAQAAALARQAVTSAGVASAVTVRLGDGITVRIEDL